MNIKSYDIIDGPSRDMLFDACKYSDEGPLASGINIPITFEIAAAYTAPKNDPGCAYIKMPIRSIQVMGIGHNFYDIPVKNLVLYGFCEADPNASNEDNANWEYYNFNASYDYKDRKGRITLILDDDGNDNGSLWKSISERLSHHPN